MFRERKKTRRKERVMFMKVDKKERERYEGNVNPFILIYYPLFINMWIFIKGVVDRFGDLRISQICLKLIVNCSNIFFIYIIRLINI